MDVSREKNGLIIPQFPGINDPSIDFDTVRSGKRARIFYFDIDLTNARTIGGAGVNAALLLQLAGNSFFVDQFTTAGFATAYFQETNLTAKGAPIYVGPGFILKAPFTQILFENLAQVGKTLRIIYGTDIDFVPGLSQIISSIGSIVSPVGVQGPRAMFVAPLATDLPVLAGSVGYSYGANFKSTVVLAAIVSEQIFSPASNVNGAIIWSDESRDSGGVAAAVTMALQAHTAAPNGFAVGDMIAIGRDFLFTAFGETWLEVRNPVRITSGKGAYHTAGVLQGTGNRFCNYTLL